MHVTPALSPLFCASACTSRPSPLALSFFLQPHPPSTLTSASLGSLWLTLLFHLHSPLAFLPPIVLSLSYSLLHYYSLLLSSRSLPSFLLPFHFCRSFFHCFTYSSAFTSILIPLHLPGHSLIPSSSQSCSIYPSILSHHPSLTPLSPSVFFVPSIHPTSILFLSYVYPSIFTPSHSCFITSVHPSLPLSNYFKLILLQSFCYNYPSILPSFPFTHPSFTPPHSYSTTPVHPSLHPTPTPPLPSILLSSHPSLHPPVHPSARDKMATPFPGDANKPRRKKQSMACTLASWPRPRAPGAPACVR